MNTVKIQKFEKAIEIKRELQPKDIIAKKYIEFTKNYIIFRFNQWHVETKKQNTSFPEHIKKLIAIITSSYSQPEITEIEYYLKQPNTHILHLAKHVYDNPDLLIDNPRRAIFSFESHDKIYTEDIGANYLFQDRYIQLFLNAIKNKTMNQINVCEVGAGTGGLTLSILPLLYNDIKKYIISDISKAFTKKLRSKVNKDKTQFEKWNIMNKNPFNSEQFNLIIASNVLHAVTNIKTALSNIYDSLTDDGYFLLHETTHGYLSNLAIWGFFKQLWDFTDIDSRTNGAFLSIEDWIKILKTSGFELVLINDDECLQSMFLFKKIAL